MKYHRMETHFLDRRQQQIYRRRARLLCRSSDTAIRKRSGRSGCYEFMHDFNDLKQEMQNAWPQTTTKRLEQAILRMTITLTGFPKLIRRINTVCSPKFEVTRKGSRVTISHKTKGTTRMLIEHIQPRK